MEQNERSIAPVAYIRTELKNKFGIPRQSGRVPSLMGRVEFVPRWRDPAAIREIEAFSHLWLIFDFSESHRDDPSPTVRPPRLGGNKKVGVFASRSPFRPNSLGLSCVKLESVEHTADCGDVLIVSGVDLLDGTPIYDIKPYIPYADCIEDAVGGYADGQAHHSLKLDFPEELYMKVPEGSRTALCDLIQEDPRPSYQSDPEREYTITFGGVEVDFHIDGDTARVYCVRPPRKA